MADVSVAIPVRDAGPGFEQVLAALAAQSVAHELVVCDSGSRDGTPERARRYGARVLEIDPSSFLHGSVRNRLMQAAQGSHVAMITQDAEPADERWLERLLAGFGLAPDVGIVFGPYRPRPSAPLPVRLELERWFRSLSPDGAPRVDRLAPAERSLPALDLVGRRGFFTDANACLARSAWRSVPYRDIAYAEDRALALDLMRAAYAKAYLPEAGVIHSHAYTPRQQLRRSFDEARGLHEVYGWREPLAPARLVGRLRGALGYARRELAGEPALGRGRALAGVAVHELAQIAGGAAGSRAGRLAARGRAGRVAASAPASPDRAGADPADTAARADAAPAPASPDSAAGADAAGPAPGVPNRPGTDAAANRPQR
jgi:rhamnosyltransferase